MQLETNFIISKWQQKITKLEGKNKIYKET